MCILAQNKNIITNNRQLKEVFIGAYKKQQKLGVEFEKIPVRSSDFKAVEFFFKNGILDFLNEFKDFYNAIQNYEENILLGLYSHNGVLSLEPGAQVEMSFPPVEKISDFENLLNFYNMKSAIVADKLGFSFLGLGSQPVSVFSDIKIIPKKRYSFMTKYLQDKGNTPFVMMRETAGVQTSIDYESEEDAIRKFSCALKLSPFLSAFFVNSPVRNGKLSGYKSVRLNAWLNTDNDRCGLVSQKLIENHLDFSFDDYANILLDLPAIFHKNEYVGSKTFRSLLSDSCVDMVDWHTQLSLYFPDVRLKNYIEIRNHDSQKTSLALAIPALYKGILYSSFGINEVEELLKDFSYFDFEFIRQNAPRFGMDFIAKNYNVSCIVKEIFNIAKRGLEEFCLGEEKYLDEAFSLLRDNMTPADLIIKNFEGSWNKDINKLVEYSKIK